MKRRDLMRLAPAALVAGAAPAVGAAGVEETPVMKLFREWQVAHDAEVVAFRESDTGECAMCEAATDRRTSVEKRLIAAPCEGLGDWALKVMAWTCFGDFTIEDSCGRHDLWAEARALIGGAA
ncbi:hypothetical protein NM680_19980 [Paracoccus sp. PS-1]|uniref:hypothetical protein n=1 Tax=Paracoccus sp. PS1 TaxID=2963938 RepID=UPI0027E4A559|nr:hypothetical protein [Paracoccus sp. PS1]MDQ7264074.1 hypothetical protein [Paracoccus sp. PS1]